MKMTQTAAHADFTSVPLLPAIDNQWEDIKSNTTVSHVSKQTSMDMVSELTYAGIMVSDIQEISTTSAIIAPPCIFAAAFRALTGFPLFAFINICMVKITQKREKY